MFLIMVRNITLVTAVIFTAIFTENMALAQTTYQLASDWGKENGTKTTATYLSEITTGPAPQPKPTLPPPTVSKETFDHLMDVMNTFNLVYEVVSLVLCLISTFIYALPSMRCATAHYLVALNISDFMSGFLVVVRTLWGQSGGTAAVTSAAYHYFTMFGSLWLSISCRRMTYCLTAMVSLERFFVIAFPMKARYIKLVKYPKISIVAIVVIILSMHVYLPVRFTVVPSSQGLGYLLVPSNAYKTDKQAIDDVSNAAKYMFSYFPLCLCLLLSVLLMVALQRHATSRQALQEGKDDSKTAEARSAERQLAMTIWLSALLYTLFSLPSNTAQVVATYHDKFCFLCHEHYLYTLVGRFAYVLLISSRYSNFLAYMGLSTTFRRNFIRIICPRMIVNKLNGGDDDKPGQKSSVATVDYSQTAVSAISSGGE